MTSTGLNFRDVLNVLGLYPGDPGPPGELVSPSSLPIRLHPGSHHQNSTCSLSSQEVIWLTHRRRVFALLTSLEHISAVAGLTNPSAAAACAVL